MQIRRPATWKDIRNLLIWITLVILYLLFVRDPDPTPWNSIHVAALDGNIEAVKQHLANGTDVNVKNNFESTPLHSASGGGHKEIVELLIAKGADADATNSSGRTPLHFAAIHDHKEIAELLIAEGADVNAKDDDGSTALDIATDPDNPDASANTSEETPDLLRKHGGKTAEELKAEGK